MQVGETRQLGVVYTPARVTEPMVRVALAPLCAGRTLDELRALRVCDPAIGEGAFVAAVVAVIAEALAAAGAPDPLGDARACVYGVDVDPRAVAIARAATGCEGLAVGDALAHEWPCAFDAVVGNPPYVRQEHLAARKPALRAFASYDGVADLYVYFLELAHRIARPGGRYCFVTPNKWLTAAYATKLRGLLAETVDGVVDFCGAPLFEGADAFPCIVWGTIARPRTIARAADDYDDTDAAPDSRPIRAARVDAAEAAAALDDLATGLAATGAPHARERFGGAPWFLSAPADAALLDRICAQFPPLGELVEPPARGVVTGYNRAFVIDRETRDRLLAAEPGAARIIRPFVKGRDVAPFELRAPTRWILLVDRGTDLSELPHVLAHLAQFRAALEPGSGRKPGRYQWYELQDPVGAAVSPSPRLLYQDIQTQPAAALSDGTCVPDTTVWSLPSADPALLAILNSPLYGWFARRRFPPALNGAVRPKWAYLRTLPIAPGDGPIDDRYELSAAERALVAGP
ncbi:MAG TPA: Eco57I restriction-modification methylase domain-containing protein [Kofleriaceae bacterium]